MTDSYKIWKPERDGHAPPNWREGMTWTGDLDCQSRPHWRRGFGYMVPKEAVGDTAEALNSPNDDAFKAPSTQQWFGQDTIDPIAATVAQLRQYPAETLAKHGITLAPEKDWATELWADLFAVRDMPAAAKSTREGRLDDEDQAAIALIRERVVLKEGV